MGLLVLFYSLVYGGGILVGGMHDRPAALVLSAFVLGTLMLLAVVLFVRRDASWRESLGLGRQPIGSMLAIDAFGLVMLKALKPMLDTLVSLAAIR